jgi:hypothetical protein
MRDGPDAPTGEPTVCHFDVKGEVGLGEVK